MSGPFTSIDDGMSASCFSQLADDAAALFKRGGVGAGAAVAALLDFQDIEIQQPNGAMVVERRPVVTLPASARPVPRGSTVSVNGSIYTVAFVMSDDGQMIEAVCDV